MNNSAIKFLRILSEANLLQPLSRRQIRLLYQGVYPDENLVAFIENPLESWENSYQDGELLLFLTLLLLQLHKGSIL